MRILIVAVLLAVLLVAAPDSVTQAGDPRPAWPWAYPGGESTQRIEGLGVTLYVPRRLTAKSGSSLLIVLHGARARGSRLATFFRYWPHENYVVCAPQAAGSVWTANDLARVRRIAKTLQAKLPLDPDRVHVAGFSNGASNLHAVAFAADIKARSGTWVGGALPASAPIPVWAQARFGALLMVGADDFALRRVRASLPLFRGKVRRAELHVEPDIGHTWPTSQIEYHLWWMGVQEGRFVPGEDLNFDWDDDLADALEAVERRKARGVLLYLYDSKLDATRAASRALQNRVFMDPGVRRHGRRFLTVKLDRREHSAALAQLGVPQLETPTVIVYGADGRPTKTLSGTIETSTLRSTLATVAGR